jgi:hypothetical protein
MLVEMDSGLSPDGLPRNDEGVHWR